MQRGGAWDNSDLTTKKGQVAMRTRKDKVVLNNKVSKGVQKKEWSATDKAYAAVGLTCRSDCWTRVSYIRTFWQTVSIRNRCDTIPLVESAPPLLSHKEAVLSPDLSPDHRSTQHISVVVTYPCVSIFQGGYKKEQSVSIFGGTPLPWITGAAKSPGVEMDNKRRLNEQKKVKRAATNAPMSAAVKRRVEKEAAEERRKQERLQKQLNGEKKGLFGMW